MTTTTTDTKKTTSLEDILPRIEVPAGKKIDLQQDYDPGYTGNFLKKKEAKKMLTQGVQMLAESQAKLYAQDNYGVLIVLQALDAAGKDGTIKHVMSGVNPQGVQVSSFKSPLAKSWIMIIYGETSKRCPGGAISEFLTVLIMRKFWW